MITREELEEIMGEDSEYPTYTERNVDHDIIAIKLLRERIPYEVAFQIICGSEHDVVYLVDIEKALPYLSKEDAIVLQECNVGIDEECECFKLYT